MSNPIKGFLVGGKTRAGKGVWSGQTHEALVGLLENSSAVNIMDQGATYRYALLRAFKAGAATKPEIQAHALRDIDQIDPDAFLEQFLHTYFTAKQELYTPHIGDHVAQIGQLDEAQHFYTDLLNRRILHASGTGVEAVVIDSRTPHILTQPSVMSGVLMPVLNVFIDTPPDIAAKREAARTGKSYQECLGSIVARTELDEKRTVLPAVNPTRDEAIVLSEETERSVLASFIDGTNIETGKILVVDNGQGTTMGALQLRARVISTYAFKNVLANPSKVTCTNI